MTFLEKELEAELEQVKLERDNYKNALLDLIRDIEKVIINNE